jgi:alpha-tubulin suppressor-like RCC1 family protein
MHVWLKLLSLLRADGSWFGFGKNDKGQLGLGDTTDRTTPTDIPALGIGIVESCALGTDHTICKK